MSCDETIKSDWWNCFVLNPRIPQMYLIAPEGTDPDTVARAAKRVWGETGIEVPLRQIGVEKEDILFGSVGPGDLAEQENSE